MTAYIIRETIGNWPAGLGELGRNLESFRTAAQAQAGIACSVSSAKCTIAVIGSNTASRVPQSAEDPRIGSATGRRRATQSGGGIHSQKANRLRRAGVSSAINSPW